MLPMVVFLGNVRTFSQITLVTFGHERGLCATSLARSKPLAQLATLSRIYEDWLHYLCMM